MGQVETVLVLLLAVAALARAARWLNVPYPSLLVLGGLALGFVPGLPRVQLPPDVVFLLFVPPLVYLTAFSTSWRDFRANLRPIGLLGVGLVLATVVAVAAVAHLAVPGMTWPLAFVLATIVAPTDTVAVTAVTNRLHVPRRIVTVLEGESLINDAVALVAYRMAVAAVLAGTFSAAEACLHLLWAAAGGVALGLAVGWLAVLVRRWLDDPPVEITVSLLTPFAAYLPAEWLGASGVLAVVTAGLYIGRRSSEEFPAESRRLGRAFWRMADFLLNGLAFILIGLQLRSVYEALGGHGLPELLGYAALVSLTAILVRVAWVFPAAYLPRLLSRSLRERDPAPPWRQLAFLAWAGMRGVDSLATSLALPLAVGAAGEFPQRGLIVFLAFGVILATLVLQGLSLPLVIRLLGLREDGATEREDWAARLAAAQAALARLDELARACAAPPEEVERLRVLYERRARRFRARLDPSAGDGHEKHAQAAHQLRLELLRAERQAAIALRDRGEIGDEALRRVERDLDLEELRLRPEEEDV